jgi:uncharacterized protein YcbK (DUF882 family)
MTVLDEFRHRVYQPVYLSCAFRCIIHNRAIGSYDGSQHPLGTAADIKQIDGWTLNEMADLAEEILTHFDIPGGVGIYPWGIHMDVRAYDASARPIAPWREDKRAD